MFPISASAGTDWNKAGRFTGIKFHKEHWPVVALGVMLSVSKEPHVGLGCSQDRGSLQSS
jgi:hypothetical protein